VPRETACECMQSRLYCTSICIYNLYISYFISVILLLFLYCLHFYDATFGTRISFWINKVLSFLILYIMVFRFDSQSIAIVHKSNNEMQFCIEAEVQNRHTESLQRVKGINGVKGRHQMKNPSTDASTVLGSKGKPCRASEHCNDNCQWH